MKYLIPLILILAACAPGDDSGYIDPGCGYFKCPYSITRDGFDCDSPGVILMEPFEERLPVLVQGPDFDPRWQCVLWNPPCCAVMPWCRPGLAQVDHGELGECKTFP